MVSLTRSQERPRSWLGTLLRRWGLFGHTEHAHIQEQLRISEDRFQRAFAHASIGMALVSLDGRWLQVNGALCEIVGYSEHELLDTTFQAITYPEDLDIDLEHVRNLLTGTIEHYDLEKRYFHKNGRLVWVQLSVSLVRDSNKIPLYFIAQIQDISRRKEAEGQIQSLNAELEQRVEARTEQLDRSRRQLATILESITDVFFALDEQGHFTYLNAPAEQLMAYTVNDVAGKTLWEILPEPVLPVFRQSIDRTRETQEPMTFEVYYPPLNAWFEAHVYPMANTLSVYLRNINERKAAEEKMKFLAQASTLLASSLEYETTLNSLARLIVPQFAERCLIYTFDEQDGLPRLFIADPNSASNSMIRSLHGRYHLESNADQGPGKVLRTGRSELVPEVDEARLQAMAHSPEELVIFRQLNVRSCITVPLTARGRVFGAMTLLSSTRRYQQADVTLAEAFAFRAVLAIENARLYQQAKQARQVAEATTERMRRMQALTAALSQAATAPQVADVIVHQGLAALDAVAGTVTTLNPEDQTLELVHASGGEAAQLEPYHRVSLDTPVPVAEAARTGAPVWITSPEDRTARYPEMQPAPEHRAWAIVPLVTEDRIVGTLGFSFSSPRPFSETDREFMQSLAHQCSQAMERARLYDAERKARADAETALRLRDEFLSVAAHELKTPITSLHGFTELLVRKLKSGQLDFARRDRMLLAIDEQVSKLSRLVSSLLDVSRIESGRLTLECEHVDLSALVERVVATERMNTTRHTLVVHVLPGVRAWVDALRLEQVLTNLIDNAIKYAPDGGPITVELSRLAAHTVRLTVADQGMGIAPEHRAYIFDRFYQAHSNGHIGGMGLGLHISRQIVELHGGQLTAEFPEEKGTRFVVTLPTGAKPMR